MLGIKPIKDAVSVTELLPVWAVEPLTGEPLSGIAFLDAICFQQVQAMLNSEQFQSYHE